MDPTTRPASFQDLLTEVDERWEFMSVGEMADMCIEDLALEELDEVLA